MGNNNYDSVQKRLLKLGQTLLECDCNAVMAAFRFYKKKFLPDLEIENIPIEGMEVFKILIRSQGQLLGCMMAKDSANNFLCTGTYLICNRVLLLEEVWQSCREEYIPFVGKYVIDPENAIQMSRCDINNQVFIMLNKIIYMDYNSENDSRSKILGFLLKNQADLAA